MKKLLGRISTQKIILTMLILELANVIIQTVLTLNSEITHNDATNKVTVTFNTGLIIALSIVLS